MVSFLQPDISDSTRFKSGPFSSPSGLGDLGSLDWDPPDPETETWHHQPQTGGHVIKQNISPWLLSEEQFHVQTPSAVTCRSLQKMYYFFILYKTLLTCVNKILQQDTKLWPHWPSLLVTPTTPDFPAKKQQWMWVHWATAHCTV